MAFDNMLAIRPYFITFVQHFIDCRFLRLWCLKNEVCWLKYLHSPLPKPPFPPLRCHKHEHYISCSQPRVRSTVTPAHLKPEGPADGGRVKTLLGFDGTWLKTTALHEAGVTNEKDVTVLRRVSCRCMQRIITVTLSFFPLKFLLMVFLSDAWRPAAGQRNLRAQWVVGAAVQPPHSAFIHPHCATDSLWVVSISYLCLVNSKFDLIAI